MADEECPQASPTAQGTQGPSALQNPPTPSKPTNSFST